MMRKKDDGFSLIEVMVAFGILLAGVIPILSMYPTITRMNQKIRAVEERIKIATLVIDYIKAKGYTDLKTIVDANSNIRDDGQVFTLTETGADTDVYTSTGAGSFEAIFGYNNLLRLSGKKVNLAGAKMWIMINPGRVESTSLNPEGGNFWMNEVLVGGVVIGIGEDVLASDPATRTGKKTEYEVTFSVMKLEDYP